MEELLPLTLGIVSEFFEAYDPAPFGSSARRARPAGGRD